MKKEYDFSASLKGKFYIPKNEINLPVYLTKENSSYFLEIASSKKIHLSKLVNEVLKKDRELFSVASFSGK